MKRQRQPLTIDAKLISYFKEVEKMPDGEKGTVVKVLAALIHENKTQQVLLYKNFAFRRNMY